MQGDLAPRRDSFNAEVSRDRPAFEIARGADGPVTMSAPLETASSFGLRAEVTCALSVGIEGNATSHLGKGWSWPEPGFTWMVDDRSEIVLPTPEAGEPLHLLLHLAPLMNGGGGQRLHIRVNDHPVADEVLSTTRIVSCLVPENAYVGRQVFHLSLEHPDHARPKLRRDDTRSVSLALKSLYLYRFVLSPYTVRPLAEEPPSDRDLMLAFESLGDNCELGLVQRRAGADPLSLLRFSATPVPALIEMIECRFAGLADPARTRIEARELDTGDAEYLLYDDRYGLTHHTLTFASEMDGTRCKLREMTRLTVAQRRLSEHLAEGDRICVIKRHEPIPDADILALHFALRELGPNTLLHVVEADDDHPPGGVEVLLDGLLRGRVTRFAPYDRATAADDASWLAMCRAAHALWRT